MCRLAAGSIRHRCISRYFNYDVENPVRALAKSRENLYYVTQHGNGTVEILTKYLQENYRKKIKAKLVDTCYNYEVYCFTVK